MVHQSSCRCRHGHNNHDPVSRRCACGCGHFQSAFLCLVCDKHWEEHETVFEDAFERLAAGRPIGAHPRVSAKVACRPCHSCYKRALMWQCGCTLPPAYMIQSYTWQYNMIPICVLFLSAGDDFQPLADDPELRQLVFPGGSAAAAGRPAVAASPNNR